MKRLAVVFLAGALLCTGCQQRPAVDGRAGKKVADQLVAAYSPLRRLSYRDACAGEGALTVCVERISISESATLVEARIRNRSRFPYVLGGGMALLANADNETVAGARGGAERQLAPGETSVQFRMHGQLRGEPVLLTVQGIEEPPMLEPPYQTGKRASVSVRLDG